MRVASTNQTPSHLFKKLDSRGKIRSFGLRIRVPKILNHQKGELKLSLHTSDRRLAQERAQLITHQLKRIWSNIQEGGALSHLSESEIDELIKNHIDNSLASFRNQKDA